MTLFIFLLTFLVMLAVGLTIMFHILESEGYDTILRGNNPAPRWLENTLFWGSVGISLLLALFAGWKFWRRGRS